MNGQLPFETLDRTLLSRSQVKITKGFPNRSAEELLKSGIICLNKPAGPNSHQVADYLKSILKLKRAGQTGTLDPAVYGVLPVVLENATRIADALLPAGKEYVALMYVHDDFAEEVIRKELEEFIGTITQLPPMKSAVKRELREREIYYIDVLEIDGRYVLFRMGCQGGTYVRKYIHDFGKKLNAGAHMKELVRTKAGPFSFTDMCTLHDVKDAFVAYEEGKPSKLKKLIFPIEKAVEHLPKVFVHDSAIKNICNGSPLYVGGVEKVEQCVSKDSLVAMMSTKNELIGLGKAKCSPEEMVRASKGVAVLTEKVFYREDAGSRSEQKAR